MAVVMVSFISCVLSLQAAASRLLFSYARDEMIVGSNLLKRLSANHVPSFALVVSGVMPACIVCLGLFMADAVATIVGFAAIGIYVAFQLIVIAALIARGKGWRPERPVQPRWLGAVGEHRRADLRCWRHHQYGLAAQS